MGRRPAKMTTNITAKKTVSKTTAIVVLTLVGLWVLGQMDRQPTTPTLDRAQQSEAQDRARSDAVDQMAAKYGMTREAYLENIRLAREAAEWNAKAAATAATREPNAGSQTQLYDYLTAAHPEAMKHFRRVVKCVQRGGEWNQDEGDDGECER
jgi:hypothetical protein